MMEVMATGRKKTNKKKTTTRQLCCTQASLDGEIQTSIQALVPFPFFAILVGNDEL